MAGAALAWRGPPRHHPRDQLIVGKKQTLLSKPSLDTVAPEANLATGQRLSNGPFSACPGGWTETPCSVLVTLNPQNASTWQWGDEESVAKGSISDGRRHTQPTGSCLRTRFTSTSLHQRQVPLPAHPCHPTLASLLSRILIPPSPIKTKAGYYGIRNIAPQYLEKVVSGPSLGQQLTGHSQGKHCTESHPAVLIQR